ncbi:hypothetical protein Tco_0907820 [Tanacetum coccineum]|uniref:Uncharacterized protein n=1 Tax=Tanacetum coccineum TaxID=301880 RepID=A0ABQ5CKK6_9ASTR
MVRATAEPSADTRRTNLLVAVPWSIPRVAAQRALRVQRASMQDLYERMGSMEIRQEAIERIEYRQAYHRDRYQGVFEHMAGVYNVLLQGNYNPPGYAQPQSRHSTTASTIRSNNQSSSLNDVEVV